MPSPTVPEICVVTTLGPVARRLLRPRVVRDQRRPSRWPRRRCGACCATPSCTRRCWAVRGEVLDSGRARRTVNRKQRRALRAMHRTCGHPGCTVPFESCRIHHVRWWTRDHGPSDLDNLLPLCEAHHHLVHEGGWTLTMTPDRVATWTRPDGTHVEDGQHRRPSAPMLSSSIDRRQLDEFEFDPSSRSIDAVVRSLRASRP